MTKFSNDEVLDKALAHIQGQSKRICACNAYPTTFTEAVSTYKLAYTTISSPDFTLGNGDTSGRKVTVGQKASVPVSTTGSANHVALVDTSGAGKVLYVTEVSATQQLTSGNTMTFEAWDIEIRDPT